MNPELYLENVSNRPWLMEMQHIHAMVKKVVTFLQREDVEQKADDTKAWVAPWDREDAFKKVSIEDGIATIPVDGVLDPTIKSNVLKWRFGTTDTDQIIGWVEKAAADSAVKAIVLDVDSPGGAVMSVPELGQAVGAARAVKPVIAFSDTLMASGAYWASAGADAIYATSSSVIGSIGVYMFILDWSEYFAKYGVKVELIKNGKFKAAGLPGTSLTEAQRDNFQEGVDRIAADFKGFIKSYRSVPDAAMEGQTFRGKDALGVNLIDSVATLKMAKRDALALASLRKK